MELLLSTILFALVATVTPGPNNIMIMTSGLNHGVTKTLPHYLGICLGFPTMVIAVGLGLGALFGQFPLIHSLIKILGISYLIYLAYKVATTTSGIEGKEVGRPLTFFQAALFQWVNPKAWVMVVGALAAFTSVGSELFAQAMMIALAFFIVSFPCVGLWLLGGASLRRWFNKPRQLQIFNLVMATLLVLSVLPVIFAK